MALPGEVKLLSDIKKTNTKLAERLENPLFYETIQKRGDDFCQLLIDNGLSERIAKNLTAEPNTPGEAEGIYTPEELYRKLETHENIRNFGKVKLRKLRRALEPWITVNITAPKEEKLNNALNALEVLQQIDNDTLSQLSQEAQKKDISINNAPGNLLMINMDRFPGRFLTYSRQSETLRVGQDNSQDASFSQGNLQQSQSTRLSASPVAVPRITNG